MIFNEIAQGIGKATEVLSGEIFGIMNRSSSSCSKIQRRTGQVRSSCSRERARIIREAESKKARAIQLARAFQNR